MNVAIIIYYYLVNIHQIIFKNLEKVSSDEIVDPRLCLMNILKVRGDTITLLDVIDLNNIVKICRYRFSAFWLRSKLKKRKKKVSVLISLISDTSPIGGHRY